MRRRVQQKQSQTQRPRPRSTRPYHDNACVFNTLAEDGDLFDTSNPDWLVGAD